MQDIFFRLKGEQQAAHELRVKKSFSKLEFKKLELVDSTTHLVLDDLSYRLPNKEVLDIIKGFEFSCNRGIKVYPVKKLTIDLEKTLLDFLTKCDLGKTVIIYPGEGAETVKSAMTSGILDSFQAITVSAKRLKSQTGEVTGIDLPWGKEVLKDIADISKVNTLLIIDDVIDSGKTIQALKSNMGFPEATWYAAALIVYSPFFCEERKGFDSSIDGYERIFASVVIEGDKISLNSLSSFVEGGQKTELLVNKCLSQYVREVDKPLFIDSLLQLGRLFGYNR